MAKEVSIEEMFGTAPAPAGTPGPSTGGDLSIDQMFAGRPAPAAPSVEGEGFIGRTKKTLKDYKELVLTATPEQRMKANIGALKAVVGGAVDLGQLALEGLGGLITASQMRDESGAPLTGMDFLRGKKSQSYPDTFVGGQERAKASVQKARELASAISNVNLAPEDKEEEMMYRLLGIIPDAITASGDTVFEKTGSALAGAGTQALLTLLTIKPSIAVKPLGVLRDVKAAKATKSAEAAKEKVKAGFEELAVKDPDAAGALIEHSAKADPALASDMTLIMEKARAKSKAAQEEAGRKAAYANMHEQAELLLERETMQGELALSREMEQLVLPMEGGRGTAPAAAVLPAAKPRVDVFQTARELRHIADETGEHRIIAPAGELIAQESNGKLQVKRTDVVKEARGTGQGTALLLRAIAEADRLKMPLSSDVSVSPAQARIYQRLAERGYEVKQNPAEVNPTTKNLVSLDPRLGVFEVKPKPGSYEQKVFTGIYEAKGKQGKLDLKQRKMTDEQLQLPFGQERKPIQLSFIPEIVAKDLSSAVAEGYKTANAVPRMPKEEPILYVDQGKPVKKAEVTNAFSIGKSAMDKVPGWSFFIGKLKEYATQLVQTFNPEAFGPEAQKGAAVLAKAMAEQMQKDSQYFHRSMERRKLWNQRMDEVPEFIRKFERGETFDDPILNKAAEAYRNWNREIYAKEQKLGIKYEPEENYLYHVFEDSKGLATFFEQKYGKKWADPKFSKERSFKLYEQALEEGFKPKFKNPEDIMLARQHASDIAEMQIQTLLDMREYGLAKPAAKGPAPPEWPAQRWRAPNGEVYWVHDRAVAVLNNAFNTQSLWTMKGLGGDAFRGAMELKNTIVPIKLALSLFHPLHVLTIHNATGMVRATKSLLGGAIGPGAWLKQMAGAAVYGDFFSAPRTGGRLLRAFQGKIKDGELTAMDKQAMQFMFEGGFTPEMPAQYKTGAINRFREAVQRGSAAAVWHLPFAAIQTLQKPMFEIWIPALKVASYLKDVNTALKVDPTLMDRPLDRMVAFRKLAKSVDNRYGEMAYSTLFWRRWVKDLAVANTLSLGWQLGFIREYGGGLMDAGQFAAKSGKLEQIKSGQLDRPLFVTFYTTQALAYGGLLTWALSGEPPQDILDYTYPKNGEVNPRDESPQRVSTMLYPREFISIYKHMEHEGILPGLGHVAANKASGVVGLVKDWSTGVNAFGREIRDPNGTGMQKLAQTLAYTLAELEPISVGDIRERATEKPVKTGVLSILGFSVAPKYITETTTQAHIKQSYQKYVAPKQTPYEKALFSDEMRKLRKYQDSEMDDKYDEQLDEIIDKFDLGPKDLQRIRRAAIKDEDPLVAMFKRIPWQVQKKLLDEMNEEDREVYLNASSKEHLRFKYEAPEEK